jgi:hypothetical protein
MSKPEPNGPRRIELFTGAGWRRTWAAAEKALFVAESHVPGETVFGPSGSIKSIAAIPTYCHTL